MNSFDLGTLYRECKSNMDGSEYVGQISQTIGGRTCQRWDEQTPHRHNVTAAILSDVTLTAAENFCRAPDGSASDGPWCYTMDPNTPWEPCHVPTCGKK